MVCRYGDFASTKYGDVPITSGTPTFLMLAVDQLQRQRFWTNLLLIFPTIMAK